jgi:acetoin utilization deacetylase AcuC-like enzyme
VVLFDKSTYRDINEFGIMIPMCASRPQTIADNLKQNHCTFPVHNLKEAADLLHITEPIITRADLERTHSKEYVARLYNDPPFKDGLKKIILTAYEILNTDGSVIVKNDANPLDDSARYIPEKATKPIEELFQSSMSRVEGCYLTARLALSDYCAPVPHFCYFLEGGAHHCRYDAPSGFGFLNDVMITAQKLIEEKAASLIWIVDVDAHKGDGTAELVKFARDRGGIYAGTPPKILALSAHMAQGWPLDKESLEKAVPGRAPLVPSDVDVPVESGEEANYVQLLAKGFEQLEKKSCGKKPDLVIVDDGMDVYEKDQLPSTALLNMTLEQCLERDKFIFSYLQDRGIASAWYMAGGYGEDVWEPTVNFLLSLNTKS